MLLVSFNLLYLYYRFNEDGVSLFLHMYILLSFLYPMTCIVSSPNLIAKKHSEQMYIVDFGPFIILSCGCGSC